MISKSYGYKENRHLYSLCILYKMNKIHLERFKIGYLFLTYISYEYQRQFGGIFPNFLHFYIFDTFPDVLIYFFT